MLRKWDARRIVLRFAFSSLPRISVFLYDHSFLAAGSFRPLGCWYAFCEIGECFPKEGHNGKSSNFSVCLVLGKRPGWGGGFVRTSVRSVQEVARHAASAPRRAAPRLPSTDASWLPASLVAWTIVLCDPSFARNPTIRSTRSLTRCLSRNCSTTREKRRRNNRHLMGYA